MQLTKCAYYIFTTSKNDKIWGLNRQIKNILLPYGHTAMRPYGHAAIRPCGHAALDTFAHGLAQIYGLKFEVQYELVVFTFSASFRACQVAIR